MGSPGVSVEKTKNRLPYSADNCHAEGLGKKAPRPILTTDNFYFMKLKTSLILALVATAAAPLQAQYDRTRPSSQPSTQQTSQQARLGRIKAELSYLREDVSLLNREFAIHLKNQACKPTPEDLTLSETLTMFAESVERLVKEATSPSSEQRLFRAFNEVDYHSKDVGGVAVRAGYRQSLSKPLAEICEHVENLAKEGFRNPRVKVEAAGHGGLFGGGGGLFRKDGPPEKEILRQPAPTPPPAQANIPRAQTVPPSSYDRPGSRPTQPAPTQSESPLSSILRTILGGGR
jgi:hypothetical protein